MDDLPERGHCNACRREVTVRHGRPRPDAYGPDLNGVLVSCAACGAPLETFVEATVNDRKKYMSLGFFRRLNA